MDQPVTPSRPLPRLVERHTDPHAYPEGVAFLDGQFVPMSEAKVSVLDYGFLHSDATYDTVHVWSGRFFRLDLHIERFFGGLKLLRMSIPFDPRPWPASCTTAWRFRAIAAPMSKCCARAAPRRPSAATRATR